MRAYNAHQFVPFKWSGRNWAQAHGLDAQGARRGARRLLRPHLQPLCGQARQGALGRQDAVPHLARGRHGARVPGRRVHRHRPPPGRLRRLEHVALGAVDPPRHRPLPPVQHGDRARGGRARRPLRRSSATRISCCGPSPSCASCSTGSASRGRRACSSTTPSRAAAAASARSRGAAWSTTRSTCRGSASGRRGWSERQRAVLRRRLERLGRFYGYDVDDPVEMTPAARGRADRGRRGPRRPDRGVRRPRPAPPAGRPGRRPVLRPAQGQGAQRRRARRARAQAAAAPGAPGCAGRVAADAVAGAGAGAAAGAAVAPLNVNCGWVGKRGRRPRRRLCASIESLSLRVVIATRLGSDASRTKSAGAAGLAASLPCRR